MKKSKIAAWVLTFAMLLETATGCKGNGTGSSSTGSMVSGEATSDSALSGSEGEDVLSGIASGLDTSAIHLPIHRQAEEESMLVHPGILHIK